MASACKLTCIGDKPSARPFREAAARATMCMVLELPPSELDAVQMELRRALTEIEAAIEDALVSAAANAVYLPKLGGAS